VREGVLTDLIHAGARLHQAGCNGCIGMGQAPATGRRSLRTVPRNFPGRSGTREDSVYLCSPETATASALRGVITDPRQLDMAYPRITEPAHPTTNPSMFAPPLPPAEARQVALERGPNIAALPKSEPLPDALELPVLLKVGDNLSTDEILPAGARVLPYRSNLPKLAEFAFDMVDPTYPARAREVLPRGGHAVVAGMNYGQGSSREHAALAPRMLGLRLVLARSFARIHWQNLVNFGVVPLTFADPDDAGWLTAGAMLVVRGLRAALAAGAVELWVPAARRKLVGRHTLSQRQLDILLRGGVLGQPGR